MPNIIGICGLKRAGKNTLADGMVSHITAEGIGTARIMSFADPLRAALYALDPCVPASSYAFPAVRLQQLIDDYGWEYVKATPYGAEVRRLLQRFGTDSVRAIDRDFWVRAFLAAARDAADFIIAPDVRFPNEADAIRGAGGVIVRVVRPGLQDATDHHPSEVAMVDVPADIEVVNYADGPALFDTAPFVIDAILCGTFGISIYTTYDGILVTNDADRPATYPRLSQANETEFNPS